MKPRPAVAQLEPYPLLPVTRGDKIRLDLNESTRGCSPAVLEALRAVSREDVSAYPDYPELLEKIAGRYGIAPEQLVLTNGADDGIRAVMQTFVDPGETVVVADPSFGMIQLHARVMGARMHPVPYGEDLSFPGEGFLQAACPAPRLIAIVRPDSPTGAVISHRDLTALLESAPHSLIMLDETYHHFLGESCLNWIHRYPNLLVVHSFSKAWGLAGLRLGFIAGAPELLTEIRKVNPPFAVNGLAVRAALAALEDEAFLQEVVADVTREKAFLLAELARLGIPARGSGANFVLMQVGEAAPAIHARLVQQNILVKNLHGIPLLRGYFRVAVGRREENLAFLRALGELL
ncbi:MAG: histidinol-phosphate aminotransferase family protein [Calditrichaeota bacterium]|nr:MAG: histidinol-phosphate aminotransferase family protein [Calditrichota bacterium]